MVANIGVGGGRLPKRERENECCAWSVRNEIPRLFEQDEIGVGRADEQNARRRVFDENQLSLRVGADSLSGNPVHGRGLVPDRSRGALQHVGDVLAVRMIADEDNGRRFWRVILRIVIRLDARAHRLQNQCVMFSGDRDVPFGTEDGFFLRGLRHGLFDTLGVLWLVGMQHE
jgi:hypothetical protein